jgi:SAM-dependent methyltransferase
MNKLNYDITLTIEYFLLSGTKGGVMPDCHDCIWRDGTVCRAIPDDWPLCDTNRIRACVVSITEAYKDLIQPEHHVLEIGCGTWSPVYVHCRAIRARWDGIDIQTTYLGERTIATRIESVEDLSFPDETFDMVIGNQTLEHWNEFGTRPELGLYQCFRVCKVGGLVCMNVPIHVHGSRMFVENDLAAIERLFRQFSSDVTLIDYRHCSDPLPPVNVLPWFVPGGRVSYNLDIRAIRQPALPARPHPYHFRHRAIREALDHRPTYLMWKAVNQVRRRVKAAALRARPTHKPAV